MIVSAFRGLFCETFGVFPVTSRLCFVRSVSCSFVSVSVSVDYSTVVCPLRAVLMQFFSAMSTASNIVFIPLLAVIFTFLCLVDVFSIFVAVVYMSFNSSVSTNSFFSSIMVSVSLLYFLVFLLCSILLSLSVTVTTEAADIQLIPLPTLDVLVVLSHLGRHGFTRFLFSASEVPGTLSPSPI